MRSTQQDNVLAELSRKTRRLSASTETKRRRAPRHRPPSFSEQFVQRPALVSRLLEPTEAALVLIVAPPGYGKTVLLKDWSEQDGRPFAWMTFDARNGADARAATQDIRTAIRRAGGDRRSHVLVLEDAHVAAPDVLTETVHEALHDLDGHSLVVVTSRSDPGLPVGQMRAHRSLVEIRAEDLAMTSIEASVLLHKVGLSLDFEAVETLVQVTEGWPAALYLAGLSLNGQPDVKAAVSRMSGENHLLRSYLHDTFLSGLPPELLSFVTETSVLEELSGTLCDAVLQTTGTEAILQRLEQMSQLLVPVDAAHTRYRWHRLLRESLRADLRRAEPERAPQLHEMASRWYEQSGDIDRAITHAVAAGDAHRVGDLLWPRILIYVMAGRNALVEGWIRNFSWRTIASQAPLAMCAAQSAFMAGHVTEAQRWRLEAADTIDHADLEAGPRSLETGLALIDTLGSRVSASRMAATAIRVHQVEPEGSPWRPVSCLAMGIALYLLGDREQAERFLQEGADLGVPGEPAIVALCLAQQTVVAIDREDWRLAADVSDEAERVLTDMGLLDMPMMALVFASMSAARARQGRLDEAKSDLHTSLGLLAALGDFVPWYATETRVLMAHTSLSLADVAGARTLLAKASRFARQIPDAVVLKHWFDDAWAHMDELGETNLAGASSLTIAELRILRFLPSHRSFPEIAMQLGVSPNTVKTHAHAIYRKLGARSRSEAVAHANDAGLLGE